jgi:hypothetical protein
MEEYIVTEELGGPTRWCRNGKLHRVNGPAITHADGSTRWYDMGKLHRIGGPALDLVGGVKEWWVNDQPHREDGPAIEHPDGARFWYQFGKLHRLDGPAVERPTGANEWWIEGKRFSEEEFNELRCFKKIRMVAVVPDEATCFIKVIPYADTFSDFALGINLHQESFAGILDDEGYKNPIIFEEDEAPSWLMNLAFPVYEEEK